MVEFGFTAPTRQLPEFYRSWAGKLLPNSPD